MASYAKFISDFIFIKGNDINFNVKGRKSQENISLTFLPFTLNFVQLEMSAHT